MQREQRNQRLLYGTILLAVLIFCGWAIHEPFAREKSDELDQSDVVRLGDRIRFTLGETNFDVAAKYFKGAGEEHMGKQVSANFWALLPDFEAFDQKENRYEFLEEPGWGRRINVKLGLGSELLKVTELVKKKSQHSVGPLSGRNGKYDEIQHGLAYYKSDSALHDVYVYSGPGTHVIFDCSPKTTVPGCYGRWHFTEGVAVHMWFKMTYLPQWRQVLCKVRTMLEGRSDFQTCESRV